MATRICDALDMLDKDSADKAVTTVSGIEKLQKSMQSSLERFRVEDDNSIIKSVDLSYIKEMLENDDTFDSSYVAVNVLPKVNMSGIPVMTANNKIKEALLLNNADLLYVEGYELEDGMYYIPIIDAFDYNKISRSRLTLVNNRGSLEYMRMGEYVAPSITMSFEEQEYGKKFTKIIYEALEELQEDNPMKNNNKFSIRSSIKNFGNKL